MLRTLKEIELRYKNIKKQLEAAEALGKAHFQKALYKEFAFLKNLSRLCKQYQETEKSLQGNNSLLSAEKDPQLLQLAKEERQELLSRQKSLKNKINKALAPTDPGDERNVIMEIRPGTGGDEACLFVKDLFEAYSQYALKKSWKVDLITLSPGNQGGYREVIANIKGTGVYSILKYESGVHRVQRIPKTESQGRIHTSTVTVVILPEADPLEVKIRQEDLRIDVCRSSGAGGQHVNTTDSAVRITHLPTKIMVYCQQEKSQHANKERAFKILYARIWELQKEKEKKAKSEKRKEQMGGGDRSQRIRTYNFPQSRLSDHRIDLTLKNLPLIMKGNFEMIFEALKEHYQNLEKQEVYTERVNIVS